MRGGGWGGWGGGRAEGEGRGERFIKAARKVVCNVRDLAIHCSGRIDV